jgi:hypothetical protein
MQKSRLEQYGMLVAGAAGAAVAGSASAALVVNGGNVAPGASTGLGGSIALDFDGDGNIDINITHAVGGGFSGDDVLQATGGTVIGGASGYYASRFSAASLSLIGPGVPASFTGNSAGYMRDGNGFVGSGWTTGDDGFLGVIFDIGGNTHYGYVEVNVSSNPGTNGDFDNVGTILSYAYESTPDTAVPEPGSLGLLALGAVGLLSRRKKSA